MGVHWGMIKHIFHSLIYVHSGKVTVIKELLR